MNWNTILLMRHEIVLAIVILVLLLADVFTSAGNKKSLNGIAVGLFAVYTAIGFIPFEPVKLFGGMFINTPLTIALKNIMNVGVLLIAMMSVSWINKKMLPLGKVAEFYLLLFSSLLGMMYMVSAGHFLMLYIGLELATLPVTALASYDMYNRKSSESGIKLILSAAFSSGVVLFGISMLYSVSGSLYFSGMTGHIGSSYLSILGMVMVFAGFGFKISLVPFHFWTADVYEGAPTPVASYLSVISKAGAVFVLMILMFVVFRQLIEVWKYLFYGIAVLTMFIGNFFAIRQKNLQRFMAFSSIAQAGFIMVGMMSADKLAVANVVYFIAIYMLSNIAVFGVIQAVYLVSGRIEIDEYNGLYRTNPMVSLVLMFGLFSLAGIPPVAGFFGKFFLYTSAASQGYYWLIFIAVVNVTISLYYYLVVVRAAFLRTTEDPIPKFKSDGYMKIAMAFLVIALIVLGLMSPFYEYISSMSNIINI